MEENKDLIVNNEVVVNEETLNAEQVLQAQQDIFDRLETNTQEEMSNGKGDGNCE